MAFRAKLLSRLTDGQEVRVAAYTQTHEHKILATNVIYTPIALFPCSLILGTRAIGYGNEAIGLCAGMRLAIGRLYIGCGKWLLGAE